MKLFITLLAALSLFAGTVSAQLDGYFSKADAFFSQHVQNGVVDYQGVTAQPAQLGKLLETAANLTTDQLAKTSAEAQKAFYINTYNLLVIATVISNPGIKSPLDVAGFFDQKLHTVAGEELTLNQIEKEKLLAAFGDPRFHFVLVCAAKDCPPLASSAFFPDQLEKQLYSRTRLALNSNSFVRLNAGDETAGISEIFKWYYKDFDARTETEARAFVNFINKFRDTPIPTDHSIEFYPYDWRLNN